MLKYTPEIRLDPARDMREVIDLTKLPFTALARCYQPLYYCDFDRGKAFRIDVWPDYPVAGTATQYDQDILIFATSLLTRNKNAGARVDATIQFRAADVFRFLGRPAGGQQHRLLDDALRRLRNTMVITDLGLDGARQTQIFSLIERVEPAASMGCGDYRITLPAFIVDRIAARQVRKLEPASLRLRGLERRIHGWGRAYTGGRGYETWRKPLRFLHALAGSQDTPRKFRAALRAVVGHNALPGLSLSLEGADLDELLVITRLGSTPVRDEADELRNAGEPVRGITLDLPMLEEQPDRPNAVIIIPDEVFRKADPR